MSRSWQDALRFLALSVVTGLVFARAVGNEFINFDDDVYLSANPVVAGGLSLESVRWALTTLEGSLWAPLTWLGHLANVSVFGLAPAGHHLVPVVLHALNVGLAWLLLRRWGLGNLAAAIAALFWGLHPLRVESVAWAAELKDVLSVYFGLLSLLAYDIYARRGNRWAALGAFLALALGLLSKPMLVTLPAAFLLLDVLVYRRISARAIIEKLPFAALAGAAAYMTLWAQRGALQSMEALSLVQRFELSLEAYGTYLVQTVAPFGLAILYPLHVDELSPWRAALSAGALIVITLLLLRTGGKALAGWLFFLGTLVPVCGIVSIGNHAHTDRFTYLPSLGLALLVGVALGRAEGCKRVAALVVLVLLTGTTWLQLGHWRNSETVFTHAIACTRDNSIAHNNLGRYLLEHERAGEGLEHIREAVRLSPGNDEAVFNLGAAYLLAGDPQRAVATLGPLAQAHPRDADYSLNLALALRAAHDERFPIAANNALLLLPPGHPARAQLEQMLGGAKTR